jgi:glyoxylase-like metal-dependent hydrolase (beta-lactamase superfamily II)
MMPGMHRRQFLCHAAQAGVGVAAGTVGLPWSSPARCSAADAASLSNGESRITPLSDHLAIYQGPINVGIVRDGSKALLIDCGDGSVAEKLPTLGLTTVDRILFTHHHRDQACGAQEFTVRGAKLVVPAAERQHFEKVEAYWASHDSRWDFYNVHPHHLMLAESIAIDGVLGPDEMLSWGPATIRVLATPGHTDGSLSYLVEVDGKRVVFCGDAIYDAGQIWELYSLQKGFQRGQSKVRDYHGFLGAQWELREGLGRIKEAHAELLVPSHGRLMSDPTTAIDSLLKRIATCYDKYVAISALRYYHGGLFTEFADRNNHMPPCPAQAPPECLRHVGTSWVLVSQDKSAFVMDCGTPRVAAEMQKWIQQRDIRAIEGLWVTHYHNDHTAGIPEFQQAFDCPCMTDEHVAQVISDPLAWRLPCLSPKKARVDRPTRHGESWTWHEFRLTSYFFPGQTLYHAGLLAEWEKLRMLFVGDSFTPTGIDDYCTQNRNWLGPDVGYDRCLRLIEELKPTHLFNCHVPDAFAFTPEQLRFMRANLAEREKLFGALFPWEHANYGMDESWVRCHPYEQEAKPGQTVPLSIVVTNHSSVPREAACRAVRPRAWRQTEKSGNWTQATVPPKAEAPLKLSLHVPDAVGPGRYVIAVDVHYDGRRLPQFSEAVVTIRS